MTVGPAETLPFQRCSWCSVPVFPAALLCPVCGSADMKWQHSRGTGRVHSSRSLSRAEAQPRVAITVLLDEGPRILGVIEGVRPRSVKVGARVRFHGTHAASDRLPVFRLSPVPDPPIAAGPAEELTDRTEQPHPGSRDGLAVVTALRPASRP